MSASDKLPPFPIEYLDLPDDQLADKFWTWWVVWNAEKKGIPQDQITPELCEAMRVVALFAHTANESQVSIEKALKIIAGGGDRACAGSLIRQWFKREGAFRAAIDEALTGSRWRRAIARQPRENALGKLVAEAMRRNPKIKPSEMLNHLRRHEGQGVIESVRDDWIEWLVSPNGRVQATP